MTFLRYESEPADPKPLGEPLIFEFSGRQASNRLLKAATTERLATWVPEDRQASGHPTPELVNLYRRWADGGYGVVVSGNIMVAEDHLEAPGNMIIPLNSEPSSQDARFKAYQDLANASQKQDVLLLGQLNHPGRQTKVELQPNPVSPSTIRLSDSLGMQFGQPHAATDAEIKTIVKQFVHASEYLYKAGWAGVQLHAAHGYLLAAFLSKTTNDRTDAYGGSFENRSRIVVEVVRGIREKVPSSFMISVKINSVEFQEGGFPTDEARDLCRLLQDEAQLDFVELSGGTYQKLAWEHKRESTRKREAFFLDFAEMITPSLSKTKSYITGGFQTVSGMVSALKIVDGIGVARAACQEIEFGRNIIEGRVQGAVKQKLDQDNFMITNVAAGTQIAQVAKDFDPIDLSQQENVDVLFTELGKWVAESAEDKGLTMHGWMGMKSVNLQPYGQARLSTS